MEKKEMELHINNLREVVNQHSKTLKNHSNVLKQLKSKLGIVNNHVEAIRSKLSALDLKEKTSSVNNLFGDLFK